MTEHKTNEHYTQDQAWWNTKQTWTLLKLTNTKKKNKTEQQFYVGAQNTWTLRSKHFNVVSTLSFGWYNVATWDNVKSTLKQRCVFQRWNLQRQINVLYFNVNVNNVRQRRSNVVIFNVQFHNVGKRRNNVVKMAFLKITKQIISNKIYGIQSFNYYFIIFFTLLPMLRGICWRVLAGPWKFFKDYDIYCIART